MTTLSIRNSISRPPLRRGLPRKQQLPRTQAMWIIRGFLLIPLALALAWLALSPTAQALCNEGCTDSNTFLGDDALRNNTFGLSNTAIGELALNGNSTGDDNTATGSRALEFNSIGSDNTATGKSALYENTRGGDNTATGGSALYFNKTGNFNTANGVNALFSNTLGNNNTATGAGALYSNNGQDNTANGVNALYSNTTGINNAANGFNALLSNTTGDNNTADGKSALESNTTGSSNIALGAGAGLKLTTGNNNIDIGNAGLAAEANTIRIGKQVTHTATYIAGISGATVAGGVGVIVDTNGHLGTVVSSARFKEEIQSMDNASEAILALKPVTFRYKQELDPEGIPQFGVVAEQVEKVNPDLVARDEDGRPYTVRYEAVNAMLLNEFLKEHRKVEQQARKGQEQEAMIAQQRKDFQASITKLQATVVQQQRNFQKEIQTLTASLKEQASQIQKVTRLRQVEVIKPAQQLVLNNQ